MNVVINKTTFEPPVSTSNLVRPDRKTFLQYAQMAYCGEPVVALLEQRLAAFHDTEHCIALCNGFWGLVLAAHILAVPGRTDVLMPSLTYRRMADVAAWARLRPRFCEVDPATLACSAASMREALSPEVGLLLAVHPIVNQCDVAGLSALAAEQGLPLLFDSVESTYEHVAGGKIGRFGRAECFSLHASKLINGCEGGYITTDDPALAARLATMRDGSAADGMDLRLNRLHAAMALANLDGLEDQVQRNRQRYDLYRDLLATIPGLRLRTFDDALPTSYKTIVVELTEAWPRSRAETLRRLNGANVLARAYYHPPLHLKPMAYPHVPASLPETERLSERFMLLPCGHHVGTAEITDIVHLLREIGE
ncbi:MAG: aminotransferase class I/II-fold pyridoxal phosphate-dependent enzyme [Acetobacteraceae bacterium]